jgi:hypothetical protein
VFPSINSEIITWPAIASFYILRISRIQTLTSFFYKPAFKNCIHKPVFSNQKWIQIGPKYPI